MIRPLISSNGCSQSCCGSNLRFLTVLVRNFKIFIMETLNKTTLDISGQIQDTVKFTDDQKIHSGKSTWNLKITVFFQSKNQSKQTFPFGFHMGVSKNTGTPKWMVYNDL